MALRQNTRTYVYGMGDNLIEMPQRPIVAQRAPTTADIAFPGTIWVDQPNDDNYILTRVVSNSATWINAGGGSGAFTTVATTAGITCGTTLVVGTTLAVLGNTTLNTGLGVVQSSAAGILSSSDGTDGQVLIASTGAAAPAWAAITAGAGINVTNGAGSIQIDATGATAVNYPTDVAGPVVPTGLGAVNVLGGSNITTDGTVANTITIDLDNDVAVTGGLTAGHDLIMSGGSMTITADDDVAQAVYIHANGGTNETIDIHSDQGTGVSAIDIHADVGGIDIDSGLSTVDAINITASDAAGGIDIDSGTGGFDVLTTGAVSIDGGAASNLTVTGAFDLDVGTTLGSLNLTAGEAAADAIVIDATDAAGGIDVDCGTGGFSLVCGNGTVAIESGTGAINVGVDAAAKTVTVGSVTGAAATVLQSGTGNTSITSTGTIDIDGTGAISINSTGGALNIGDDNDAQAINVGTSASARTVTIGNTNTTTGVVLDSGSGDITANATLGSVVLNSTEDVADCIYLHANAGTTETIRLHSDQGTSSTSVHMQSDVGGCAMTAGLAAANSIVINASNAAGGIDIDYGTGGMTIDATNGAFTLQTGTGAISLGADAVAKTVTVGTTTGAGATTIQSGSGNTAVTSTGAILLDSAGVLEINSSGGAISIGNDVIAQAVNVATGGDRTVIIGSGTGVNTVTVECGTGGANFGTTANAHTTTLGSTTTTSTTVINAGTGGLSFVAAGDIDPNPATVSGAGAALTLNAKFGVCTHTGITTAVGAQQTFTITNSEVSATSAIFVTVNNIGSNDCRLTLERVKPAAGSFTVDTQNNGGAICNGSVYIAFWVLTP